MIHILYSADYELYLGENFLPEEEVLIEPTRDLLDACDELGVPMTLFCDVACVWRYREEGLEDFPRAVEDQLRDAVVRGHDVQAHLHPHWLHSRRDGRRWRAEPSSFLLGGLADDPAEVERIATQLLRRAADYLEDVIRPVDADYRCTAYRAGNYGLQPREREVLAALLSAGYLVDSSVVPGHVQLSEPNSIDFSKVPRLANYRLSPAGGLETAAAEGILEVPVAAARYGRRDTPAFVLRWLRMRRLRRGLPVPRGATIQISVGSDAGLSRARRIVRKAVAGHTLILELGANAAALLDITERYLASLPRGDDVYFSFSCHPKALGDASFRALRDYHHGLEGRYGDGIRALSFRELAAGVAAEAATT